MKFCQLILVSFLVYGLFTGLHQDFNGRVAKPAGGFRGAVSTVVSTALVAWLYYAAGAMSMLLQ